MTLTYLTDYTPQADPADMQNFFFQAFQMPDRGCGGGGGGGVVVAEGERV